MLQTEKQTDRQTDIQTPQQKIYPLWQIYYTFMND